jgi:hypothetical protein
MIRITKWLNPDEYMWTNGMKITIMEWAKKQRSIIERKTGKQTYIKNRLGKIAIYRERLK